MEEEDAVLSTDDDRSFLDKQVQLCRVEPVFLSLEFHSIFRLRFLDTLLFPVAFSFSILSRA